MPRKDQVQELTLNSADGNRIAAWWCPLQGFRGVVLVCHGNAGNVSDWVGLVLELQRELKQSVLIFDYPGYGRSGGKPGETGCYAAADAAYDWLVQTQRVPAGEVLIYGESLGGAVAADLASRREHRAVCLVRTFTSVPDMAREKLSWLPASSLVTSRFDTVKKVGRCDRPVFVAHGTADRVIPFAQGEQVFAAAHEPKHFCRLNGLGHNDPPGAPFYAELREFLETQAPLPGAPAGADESYRETAALLGRPKPLN